MAEKGSENRKRAPKTRTKTSKFTRQNFPKKNLGGQKPNTLGDFAVISTGGKQYKVGEGQTLKIEKIKGDFKEGGKLSFDRVLLVNSGTETKIGNPEVAGAKVGATIQKIGRSPKVLVIKYKQKSRYYKKNTHRQAYFEVKIDAVK